jgi:hypothetical protein
MTGEDMSKQSVLLPYHNVFFIQEFAGPGGGYLLFMKMDDISILMTSIRLFYSRLLRGWDRWGWGWG